MGLEEQLSFFRQHNRVRNRPLSVGGKKLNTLRQHVKEQAYEAFIRNKSNLAKSRIRKEIEKPSLPKTTLDIIIYLSKVHGFDYGNIIGNVRRGNKSERNFRSACIMAILYIFGHTRETMRDLSDIFEASPSFMEEYKRSYKKHENNIKKSRFSLSITSMMLADINAIKQSIEDNK